jgi:hypothetical protein
MSKSAAEKHQFDADSGLTFREVFNFAFRQTFIPRLQALAGEMDKKEFLTALERTGCQAGLEQGREVASGLPSNDFAAFKALVRQLFATPVYRGALVSEFVEDSDSALEVRINECLWAKTFRDAGATDLGYAGMCLTDYGFPRGFNPRIRLVRTSCLMRGDDYCNHRWVLKE